MKQLANYLDRNAWAWWSSLDAAGQAVIIEAAWEAEYMPGPRTPERKRQLVALRTTGDADKDKRRVRSGK